MLLPGPEAQQLAIYIGWLCIARSAASPAGILFVLPGATRDACLSTLYVSIARPPLIAALFFGVKAAVLAVVFEAVIRIGRRALKNRGDDRNCGRGLHCYLRFRFPFPLIVLLPAWRDGWGIALRPAFFRLGNNGKDDVAPEIKGVVPT